MKIKKQISVKREDVVDALKKVFANHIGRNNAISSEQLFFKITGKSASDVDYYEREHKWNSIKRLLGSLRKSGELFVIMGASHHYVLNSEDELEAYKSKVDATVKGLNSMKGRADTWVKSDKLKELSSGKMKELMSEIE